MRESDVPGLRELKATFEQRMAQNAEHQRLRAEFQRAANALTAAAIRERRITDVEVAEAISMAAQDKCGFMCTYCITACVGCVWRAPD